MFDQNRPNTPTDAGVARSGSGGFNICLLHDRLEPLVWSGSKADTSAIYGAPWSRTWLPFGRRF